MEIPVKDDKHLRQLVESNHIRFRWRLADGRNLIHTNSSFDIIIVRRQHPSYIMWYNNIRRGNIYVLWCTDISAHDILALEYENRDNK